MADLQTATWTSRILRFGRVRQALGLGLLALVAVSAAFLLTPSRFTPAIPGDDALGTLFSGTLKANRDYDVLDPETTEEKREEAARSVWPVYDFDGSAAALLQRRIADAFAGGRDALQLWKRANPSKAARATPKPEHKLDPDVLKFYLSQREEFWKALQAAVEDDDYLELPRTGFDPSVQRAAERLAALAAAGFTVEERGLLAAHPERGIVVRTVGDAPAPEQAVRDIDRIRDLFLAKADVERLAQVQLADLPPRTARAVAMLVRRALRPNLAYDDAETRRRQDQKRWQVKDVILQVRKGEKIIGDGEQGNKTHLLIFHPIRAAGRASEGEQG